MHIRKIINRPTSIALKRDPEVRARIREACQAVLDAKDSDSELEAIKDLQRTMPR